MAAEGGFCLCAVDVVEIWKGGERNNHEKTCGISRRGREKILLAVQVVCYFDRNTRVC